ncbi:MAG: hypothetical protein QNL05_02000 [Gammaproteobacteria bacterium]|nr:hypothetical protein [Gammaproteobacteria bacterium]
MNDATIPGSGRAFIVRPFNVKKNRAGEELDFDRIHRELITPVLTQLGFSGGTTGEFVQQGNIREDMFRELLAADLVIADISIHNANAFYELGIRHGMRDRFTVMIKASKHTDPNVFDLSADRYMPYDPDDPAASVETLKKVVQDTLKSEQGDSPVFKLLPGLENMSPEKVIIVPQVFREQVGLAQQDVDQLLTLVDEATGQSWEKEGLRKIGRSQFKLKDFEHACATWEQVRKYDMFDIEANQKLATCYQKTENYVLSDQAAERALKANLNDWDRAETWALIGSNHKTQWRQQWQDEPDLARRQQQALVSDLLNKSYEAYRKGYEHHRSHYYSGLNAVAIRSIQVELALLHPEKWALEFDDEDIAAIELRKMKTHLAKLVAATDLAIESSVRNYESDDWAPLSAADLLLITCDRPDRVRQKYQKCIHQIKDFNADSLRNQVQLYQTLGLFEDNVAAALEIVG